MKSDLEAGQKQLPATDGYSFLEFILADPAGSCADLSTRVRIAGKSENKRRQPRPAPSRCDVT